MSAAISKITYANNITLITLADLPCDSAVVASVLTAFAQAQVDVDMISQTAPQGGEMRLSFTISDDSLGDALTILGGLRKEHPSIKPEVLPGNCKLGFFDTGMLHCPGVAADVFSTLSRAGIQMELITTSEVDISLLVAAHYATDALQLVEQVYGTTPVESV
ncbi:MAG: hypothetical protein LUE61_05685 [Clostridiales bacterium]|nr:hypothetical protein [Clostridiales bacterium]